MPPKRQKREKYILRNGQRIPLSAAGYAGKPGAPPSPPPPAVTRASDVATSYTPAARMVRASRAKNEELIIQIGLDFGTSFSKCVCRDLVTEAAWIHLPAGQERQPLPFLIPGSLLVRDGKFAMNGDPLIHYPSDGLYHLKPALDAVARGDWQAAALAPYRQRAGDNTEAGLADYVEAATTYFLANTLADIRCGVRRRYEDFGAHPSDTMMVNMAIPVENMTCPEVHTRFLRVLERAWVLSERVADLETSAADAQRALLRETPTKQADDMCYLYPEVSAGVQGFIRSRTTAEGTYLCTDVGASTVDQSLFIFHKRDGENWLTYLDATVAPLGSGQIDRMAAGDASGDTLALERWRALKEGGVQDPAIREARLRIGREISTQTGCLLKRANKKLHVPKQLTTARVLYIGGGFCQDPYGRAVAGAFVPQAVGERVTPVRAAIMPPRDLSLDPRSVNWMPRLYVAYGLCFHRDNLTPHMFPSDLPDLTASDRKVDHGWTRGPITKDLC
jgi:hypothetical protein